MFSPEYFFCINSFAFSKIGAILIAEQKNKLNFNFKGEMIYGKERRNA
jgi:hypothetical protein